MNCTLNKLVVRVNTNRWSSTGGLWFVNTRYLLMETLCFSRIRVLVDPLDIRQISENRCPRQDGEYVCMCMCVCAIVRSSIRATIGSTITRVHFTIPRFHDSSRIAVDISVWGGERIFSSSRCRGYDGRATMYEGVLKRARTRSELAAHRGWFSSSAGYRLPCTQCHIVGTRGADTTPAFTETLHGVAKPAGHGERRCQGACHRSIRLWSRDIHWPRNSIGICGGGGLIDLSN